MEPMQKEESRLNKFLSNPAKALWSLAIPIMAGMGIQTFYNIVDMIFIGQLGGEAITGIAFNMPLFFLALGLTMGLGTGVTSSIARFIGKDDNHMSPGFHLSSEKEPGAENWSSFATSFFAL